MSTIKITKENFQDTVLKSDKLFLLDFYADWCGPCRMVSPILEEIASEREDISVGKVNVDTDGELAGLYSIHSIPTLMVFKNGEAVKKVVGAIPKKQILEMVEV